MTLAITRLETSIVLDYGKVHVTAPILNRLKVLAEKIAVLVNNPAAGAHAVDPIENVDRKRLQAKIRRTESAEGRHLHLLEVGAVLNSVTAMATNRLFN